MAGDLMVSVFFFFNSNDRDNSYVLINVVENLAQQQRKK